MYRAVYLGGVKGVGKTSLLTSLIGRMGYKMVDPAIGMMKITLTESRDDLDELSTLDRMQARVYTFRRVLEGSNVDNIVFDGHFSIPNAHGHEWGIPFEYWPKLGAFILVTADPVLVLERRKKDTQRKRETLNLPEILLDSEVEKAYARFICEYCKKPLYVVENHDFELAQSSLLRILSELQLEERIGEVRT